MPDQIPVAQTPDRPHPGRLARVSFSIGLVNFAITLAATAAAYAAGYPLEPSYADPWMAIGAWALMAVFFCANLGAATAAAGFVALAEKQAPHSWAVAAVVLGLISSLWMLAFAFVIPYLGGAR